MDGASFSGFAAYWPGFLGIVLLGGVVGFVACFLARLSMLRPVHPTGPFRLQGTVPRAAEQLAERLADLVCTEILSEQELFSRLDPDLLTDQVRGALAHTAEELAVELLRSHRPGLWELLPEGGKRRLVDDIVAAAPRMARRTVVAVQVDASDVFDLRSLVRRALTADPSVLVHLVDVMTRRTRGVVERTGTVFGLAVGVVAALLVGFTGHPLLLPIFGLVAGAFARRVGLRALLGPDAAAPDAGDRPAPRALTALRGQIATDTAAVFATEIVTFDNLVTELLHGPRSQRLHAMIRRDVQQAADTRLAVVKPLVTVAVGPENLRAIRNAAAERSLERLPETVRGAERYIARAMDVRATVGHRIRRMSPSGLRALLLPALMLHGVRLSLPGTLLGVVLGVLGWAVWA